jgi:intracellular multiplication protein IcmK
MTKWVFKSALIFLTAIGINSYSFAQEASVPVLQSLSQLVPNSVAPVLAPTPTPTPNPNSNPQPSFAAPAPSAQPVTVTPPASPAQFEDWLQTNGYVQNSGSSSSINSNNTFNAGSATPTRARPNTRTLSFEQEQQAMLDSAPPVSTPPSPDSVAAFNAMLKSQMPLAPQQVVQLRQQIDVAQRAAAIPANIPPKPVSTTLMINLAPGTTPPAVRLAAGYVSSLVFVDSTGAPWPIAAFDVGNPRAVGIQWDGKSNILIIQAMTPYSNGDIVIRLVGLPTPVTLELVSGQRVVDYRVDIHVSGIGPNTKELPLGTSLPGNANQLLLGVLDGVAPAGSRLLTVGGATDCEAWVLGEKMYLRTRMTVLSPGWVGKMVSPDGMQAYELPKTSSVLISKYGEPAELKIEGF